MQLFPDICNWKPKSKGITLKKFCVLCLVVPDVMTSDIRPADIELLYEKALRAADDKTRHRLMLEAALEQEKLEEGLTQQEKDAIRRKKRPPPTFAGRKTMDAEVFSEFALPMVRQRWWYPCHEGFMPVRVHVLACRS